MERRKSINFGKRGNSYKRVSNPTLRTIAMAKLIYDRKTDGEFLETIRAELGIGRAYCSLLYHWYGEIYKKGKHE